jgi:hypothetical protein
MFELQRHNMQESKYEGDFFQIVVASYLIFLVCFLHHVFDSVLYWLSANLTLTLPQLCPGVWTENTIYG